jgi:hypothetical protein
VHLDSGTALRDLEHRRAALSRLDEAVAGFLSQDTDVIILGDVNTMGTGTAESVAAELQHLTDTAAAEAPGFAHFAVVPQCTEYF